MKPLDQQELRDEIRWLGEVLGHVLREQAGDPAFERVEEVRALARARRRAGPEEYGEAPPDGSDGASRNVSRGSALLRA